MGRSETLNLLNARECERAPAGAVLRDGGGLYLEISASGKRYWRFRYTRPNASQLPAAKRRNRLSVGEFPKPVSLADARVVRDGFRADLAKGIDPAKRRRDDAAREAQAQVNTLKALAETWFPKQGWSQRHREEWERALQRHVFAQTVDRQPLGDWPISEIKIRHIMEVLQRMEDENLIETLHRCRQKLVHIFNRAIVLGLRPDNPLIPLTKEYRPRRRNVPGLIALPWQLVGAFQSDVEGSDANDLTKLAMKFMLNTVQRSSEMRAARWEEVDWRREIWTIPATRMKGNPSAREDQLVPLSSQAQQTLRSIQSLHLSTEYIFPVQPGPRAKYSYMSENTLQKFCDQLGYKGKMHVHGLRKTFSTRMNELRHVFNSKTETDAIEMCLDHFERDPIRGTYNQAEHMDVRAEIMQVWADELDQERIRFADQRDRVLIPQALPQTQKPKQSGVVVS